MTGCDSTFKTVSTFLNNAIYSIMLISSKTIKCVTIKLLQILIYYINICPII